MESIIEEKIIPSIEKLIKLTKEIQQSITELSNRMDTFEKNHLNPLAEQVSMLTLQVNSLENDNRDLRTQTQINYHQSNAEEELYNYMFSVKDEDANDLPMSNSELKEAMAKFVRKTSSFTDE